MSEETATRVPFFRNRDYLFLVGAQGLSLTGREIESLVLPLLVLALTGSPAQVGLIAAAQTAPYVVLSLFAGALVDRWDRKWVMLACDAVRAIAFASLPLALSMLFGPVVLAMIVMARQEFHAAPAAIGVMFSAGGVAGVASTLAAPWFRKKFPAGAIIVYGVAIWALGLCAIAGAGSMIALGAAWLILPGVSGVRDVTSISYRLSLIPAQMQGRVNSVFRFVAWGLRPAALALGGFAIGALGPRPTLWILAAGMTLTAAAILSPLRRAK